MTTPAPGNGGSAQVTTKYFDNMGRVWKSTLPDGTSVTNEYFTTGLLKKKYGSRLYPVEYTYDAQGRMLTMKTWKNFSANAGSATTSWSYDQYRGWLTGKTYDGGAAGPSYTYTAAGRLASRLWARGTNTTYHYSLAGDLSTTFYSDTSTTGITNAFDRSGRVSGVTNGASICTFNLGDPGQLLSEKWSAGPLNGLTVSNVYDATLRRTTNGVWNGTVWLTQARYAYDPGSRLSSVGDGTNSASYSYVANSPLVSQIGFTNISTRRMLTAKGYDFLNRLTNITSTAGATMVASFNYQYNTANQRTSVTNADGSYIVYSYDSLGQVTAGNKYWSDETRVAGQQFNYAFDDIGNRKTAATGGDVNGVNLRSATYGANSLNQYTNRTVPGNLNVIGSANSNATVSLWTDNGAYAPTLRKGTYFQGELSVDNSTNPLWLTITNVAVVTNGASPDIITNTIGIAFLPQTAESFLYDSDGNLTVDGRWTNSWNGENRLIGMVCQTNAAAGSKRRLTFGYDYQGRRIAKQVETWTGSAWSVTVSNKFLYDGWNLIAELNGTNNVLIRSYMWGTDLSGSMQGAGGVGGLLAENDAVQGVHFVAFDGNGDVSGLVKATDATGSANYEYGPFGEVVKSSGLMAKVNPVRFSTKYQDDETDLLYYGNRYYDPGTGRWKSRDPAGEDAGEFNRYGFVGNEPLTSFDELGLFKWTEV